MTLESQYEKFNKKFKADPDAFREALRNEAVYDFSTTVKALQKLQINISHANLTAMFGGQLGSHLWEKFVVGHHRNLLTWLQNLTDEYRFFILHELKTNPYLG